MNLVVPFFLIAPLFLVPFGLRLLVVASPGAAPATLATRAALPAALLLTLSFASERGIPAAALSLPWLAVAASIALAAGVRLLKDPARFRPSVRHATDAAVAFLAIGATFATIDRLGARPLDFAPEVILLTAVHFHFAGFVLPLAGALAYGRRPARWLELALGAVVFGIPITALGFIGVAYANWLGAMLTAIGGFGVGLATIAVAPGLQKRAARLLAGISGISLLVSMPMAAIYATGALVGTTWLDISTMARIHGALNALGFALPAVLAWTIERSSQPGTAGVAHPMVASRGRRWATGLLVGLVVGVGVLVGGVLVAPIGIAAVLLLAVEPGRDAPVGGLLSGFGGAWLVLFVRAGLSCNQDCIGPDLTPWFAFALLLFVTGAALTARTVRGRALGVV